MTDNRLRCALVYRLDGSPSSKLTSTSAFGSDEGDVEAGGGGGDVAMGDMSGKVSATLLAKYDHAAQYETHAGGSSEDATLYGGRDKNYADAVAMVISNDPPVARPPTEGGKNTLGGFKVVQSEVHQVVYGVDADNLCMAVITGLKYPSRVAIQMLMDMHSQFTQKFSMQVPSATQNSLTRKSKSMLSTICERFDDLNSVDKASALIDKVDEVKSSMQGNIAAMLKNTEKSESLATQSEQLSEQANVFKKKSNDLRKQMRCKNLKMTILLVALVVGILIIFLVPLIRRVAN